MIRQALVTLTLALGVRRMARRHATTPTEIASVEWQIAHVEDAGGHAAEAAPAVPPDPRVAGESLHARELPRRHAVPHAAEPRAQVPASGQRHAR